MPDGRAAAVGRRREVTNGSFVAPELAKAPTAYMAALEEAVWPLWVGCRPLTATTQWLLANDSVEKLVPVGFGPIFRGLLTLTRGPIVDSGSI